MDQEKFRPNSTSETLPMGFSLGVAVYPDDGKSAHDLIAYADATLYTEKSGGLHLVQFTRDIETEYAVAHPSNARTPHNGLFATLFSLVVAIDKKDRYTKRHSEHVALWSAHLATARGLPDITVSALKVAGLLHDVGKIGIPDSILRKPGPLSADEYEIMKGHVALSERLIQDVPYQREVLEAVACHHERWDGRGYPRGLKGDEMPITGRIMALIDAYSAMSLDRPYRRAKSFDEICEQLRSGAGTQFDATLVEPFIELLATYGNKHADDNDAEIETLRSWSTSPTPSARAVSNG
jgi:HD-GYP domain-containing protein (c-di-GMP phosphodiesterase class II)